MRVTIPRRHFVPSLLHLRTSVVLRSEDTLSKR